MSQFSAATAIPAPDDFAAADQMDLDVGSGTSGMLYLDLSRG